MILPSVFIAVTFLKILVPDRTTAVTDNVSLRPLRFDVFLTANIFCRRIAIIKRFNRFVMRRAVVPRIGRCVDGLIVG